MFHQDESELCPKAVQIIHSLASNHLIFERVRIFRADIIAKFLQMFVPYIWFLCAFTCDCTTETHS